MSTDAGAVIVFTDMMIAGRLRCIVYIPISSRQLCKKPIDIEFPVCNSMWGLIYDAECTT